MGAIRWGPRPMIARIAFLLFAAVATLSLYQFWHLAAPATQYPHAAAYAFGDSSKSAGRPSNATVGHSAVASVAAAAGASTSSSSSSPPPPPPKASHAAQLQKPNWGPRNSTLGFDAILALSKGGETWRVQGLHAAGALTGVNVTIAPQPTWSKEMIDAFAAMGPKDGPKPGFGSAAAWLAHIDLLKHVIQSDLNSALIMEDDVDWDVNIKEQLSQAAVAVREHTKAPFEAHNPYSSLWDDPTVVRHSSYEGFAAGYINDHFPEGQRAVYRSQGAICSYAYAVNRRGVRKVLEYVSRGQEQAFDTKLFHGCREGALDCISVNPELFRHFQPDLKFGQTSEVDKQNWGGEDKVAEKEGGAVQEQYGVAKEITGTTKNIKESARCKALWDKKCSGAGKMESIADMMKNKWGDMFGRK
ncbi:hypothetical protein PG988_011326 [Apiospora saccharicola]